ncbi:MAG TPA: SRPBCC domain-containing protein [Ohtaekwangia sp.]|nr:SRPBCC domain-containing protein [Ohtaekwangia sp.]
MMEPKLIADTSNLYNPTIMDNSFSLTIFVNKSPGEAFHAIKNFRGWWSEEIDGNTGKLNEIFFYHYKDIHLCKMKLVEMIPGKRLVYQVIENEFNFVKDKTEWVDTKLTFDISAEAGQTKVEFIHHGLVPEYECYQVCNDAWSGYIGNSLKNFIETGKGNPNPKDKDGFNAALAEKWGLD